MLLDKESVLARVEGDLELLRELITLFQEANPRLLADIHGAVESQDGARLKTATHALRGAAGNFRAQSTVDLAQRLEDMAIAANLADAPAAVANLEKTLERLNAALTALAQNGAPPHGSGTADPASVPAECLTLD